MVKVRLLLQKRNERGLWRGVGSQHGEQWSVIWKLLWSSPRLLWRLQQCESEPSSFIPQNTENWTPKVVRSPSRSRSEAGLCCYCEPNESLSADPSVDNFMMGWWADVWYPQSFVASPVLRTPNNFEQFVYAENGLEISFRYFYLWVLELQTKVREDFTITSKAPTRAFSWLKVPARAFTFNTLY